MKDDDDEDEIQMDEDDEDCLRYVCEFCRSVVRDNTPMDHDDGCPNG